MAAGCGRRQMLHWYLLTAKISLLSGRLFYYSSFQPLHSATKVLFSVDSLSWGGEPESYCHAGHSHLCGHKLPGPRRQDMRESRHGSGRSRPLSVFQCWFLISFLPLPPISPFLSFSLPISSRSPPLDISLCLFVKW